MLKQTLITILVLYALGLVSCTDSLNSNTDDVSDVEFMEPMTTALVSVEGIDATGYGIFMLHWDGLKPHFTDQNQDELGMAMAIGFESETDLKPPHHSQTADMGTVTIQSPKGESIELTKRNGRFMEDHLVYSNRHFGPFQEHSTLTFEGGGQYSIQTSGSAEFPTLDLDVTAPEKKVSILTPSIRRLQNHSGDLELTWVAIPGKPVAIQVKPAMDPRYGKKPGPFNREDSEMILLEDQDGSFTISGELLSKIAAKSDGNAVHISVGQLHINDIEADGKTYRVIMKTGDNLLVELGS